jgi:O-antigen/teichoic acid export membrane protein
VILLMHQLTDGHFIEMATNGSDRKPRSNGALEIILATAIGGGSGYILTVIAGITLGTSGYALFAVFYSTLYLVASAISGIQQEVARATHPAPRNERRRPVARNFAIVAAVLLMFVVLASSPIWSSVVFVGETWFLVVPLALGLGMYVVFAVLSGVLYGLELWRFIAILTCVDGLLRLVLVGGLLVVSHSLIVLAWGVVVPFFVSPVVVWFLVRRRVVSQFTLDVGYRKLVWNVARTVLGAAATGIMISGFPLLLSATSTADPRTSVSALIFASNLTRAPIVIVVLAMQSFLVIYFRGRAGTYWRHLGVIVGGIVIVTAIVTVLVGWLGPWIFRTFFGAGYVLSPEVLRALVSSAGAVAILCATGAAVLALGRHAYYTGGWVVAAAATIGILLLPLPLTERTILALWGGPILGLAVHGVGMGLGRPHTVEVTASAVVP